MNAISGVDHYLTRDFTYIMSIPNLQQHILR